MRRDTADCRDNALVVLRDGTLAIAVARCVHCERVTLAPTSDQCGCGAELHPVVRFVKLDHPYRLDQIQPSNATGQRDPVASGRCRRRTGTTTSSATSCSRPACHTCTHTATTRASWTPTATT